jgi:hypothetical protein
MCLNASGGGTFCDPMGVQKPLEPGPSLNYTG